MNKKYKELTKLSLYLLSTLLVISVISFEGIWAWKQMDIVITKDNKNIDLKQYVDEYKDYHLERYIGREIMEDLYNDNSDIYLDKKDIEVEHSFSNLDKSLIFTDDVIYLSGKITNSIIIGSIETTNIDIDHSLIIGINNSYGNITFNNSLVYFKGLNNLHNITYVNNSLLGLMNFNNTSIRGYQISPNNSYIDVKTI